MGLVTFGLVMIAAVLLGTYRVSQEFTDGSAQLVAVHKHTDNALIGGEVEKSDNHLQTIKGTHSWLTRL